MDTVGRGRWRLASPWAGSVATVANTAMTFVELIKVGDWVSIYGEVSKVGRTSITIALETVGSAPSRAPSGASRTAPSCSWRSTTTASRGRCRRPSIAGGNRMKAVLALALACRWPRCSRRPSPRAHPHMWIQQVVRVVAKDGKYTHVEIEWRFDPFSSEIEIPLIDENKDGKFSSRRDQGAGRRHDAGAEELRLPDLAQCRGQGRAAGQAAGLHRAHRRSGELHLARLGPLGRRQGRHADAGEQARQPADRGRGPAGPRNLVYVMRFDLPQPTKVFSITTFDPDDFIRIEVNKDQIPAGCALAKSTTYKAEFVRGYPVFADTVTCQLP